MNAYDVYFENIFWGYCWANNEAQAIENVAGKDCFDEHGNLDLRWHAVIR